MYNEPITWLSLYQLRIRYKIRPNPASTELFIGVVLILNIDCR
jgi:hypothetical protein